MKWLITMWNGEKHTVEGDNLEDAITAYNVDIHHKNYIHRHKIFSADKLYNRRHYGKQSKN